MTESFTAGGKTPNVRWYHKNFCVITPSYRDLRSKSGKPIDKCYRCKHKFDDGDMFSLVAISNGIRNVCQFCINDLIDNKDNQ